MMKRLFLILGLMLATCVVGILALYWQFYSPYPSKSNVRAWEENYRSKVSSHISDFQGHWVSGDIAAYIYSYHYTAETVASHQAEIIHSLDNFKIYSQSDDLLVLRKPATGLFSEGYDEWRFLFSTESKLVTVLYANLDSEIEYAEELVSRTQEFHQKRIDTER